MSSLWWAWAKKANTLMATTGPTSRTSKSCSALAFMMASMEPKCLAKSLAVDSPTWRIPKAYKNFAKVVALDASMLFNTFEADFSAMRSRTIKELRPKRYKSATVLIVSVCTNCSMSFSPKSSMFIARLDAKCQMACIL